MLCTLVNYYCLIEEIPSANNESFRLIHEISTELTRLNKIKNERNQERRSQLVSIKWDVVPLSTILKLCANL